MKTKFNNKYLAVPAIAALGVLAAGTAFAQGGPAFLWKNDPVAAATQWEQKLNDEAGILGITADEMKSNWAQGKGVREIAKEKGISDADLQKKFQAAREQQHKDMLQALVNQGKITQAQADARLKFMQSNPKPERGMRGHRGHGPRGQQGAPQPNTAPQS